MKTTARKRLRWAVVAVSVGSLVATACGGANERRPSTNAAAGAPSVPQAPAAPPSLTGPTKPPDPKCGPMANFQLWNFSALTLDVKQFPDQKDGVIKGLETAAAEASAAIPELAPALKVVVGNDKAILNGQGSYTPAAGEPSVEDAGKKLFEWSAEKSCG